jgi:V/A-type H+-transporting ATPase subunit K
MFEALTADVATTLAQSVDLSTIEGTLLQGGESNQPSINKQAGLALSIGLAAIATGYAQRGIGSAAVGAVAEDSDNLVSALLFTALPETLIIIAFAAAFIL